MPSHLLPLLSRALVYVLLGLAMALPVVGTTTTVATPTAASAAYTGAAYAAGARPLTTGDCTGLDLSEAVDINQDGYIDCDSDLELGA